MVAQTLTIDPVTPRQWVDKQMHDPYIPELHYIHIAVFSSGKFFENLGDKLIL